MVLTTPRGSEAMHVAVTGGASKGGAVIARVLESAGLHVRAGVHARELPQVLAPGLAGAQGRPAAPAGCPAAECSPIDMLRPDTLGPFFDGVDAAVLVLPQDRSIVSMAAGLVAAAEDAGVGQLVLISFIRAGETVGGPLLRWHFDVEELVHASRLAATCLRPNFYMQNFLSAFRPTPALNEGLISYVDARDVAEVVLAVLADPRLRRTTHTLTGPRSYSVDEVMRLLEGEIGPPVNLPSTGWDEVCTATRRSAHAPEVQALCEVWQAATEGRFSTVTADVERILGRPATSLETFVRDHRGQCRSVVSVAGASRHCA
jgi:NAD(P)H dehydrogenase (quinone)